MVYCSGPMYLDVGKSSYVRLVSWIFPLILKGDKLSVKDSHKLTNLNFFPPELMRFHCVVSARTVT